VTGANGTTTGLLGSPPPSIPTQQQQQQQQQQPQAQSQTSQPPTPDGVGIQGKEIAQLITRDCFGMRIIGHISENNLNFVTALVLDQSFEHIRLGKVSLRSLVANPDALLSMTNFSSSCQQVVAPRTLDLHHHLHQIPRSNVPCVKRG
jgi:hypothetical protein